MKAIRIEQHGGPEALRLVELPVPEAREGYAVVHNCAIGVNYVDIQHRQGGYYPVQLPIIPGIEAAGVVEAVGADVSRFKPGDRVAYAGYMGGNYAEYTLVPEDQLVPLPEGVDFDSAAAGLLQGMTAHCLTHDVYAIRPGDVALIHAAAGGVGSMLVQMARRRGATVIGTVSSDEKGAFARQMGSDYTIRYDQEDFAAVTRAITGGAGVHVVYDANGRSTFDQSLSVLRRQGCMVVYGQTSGAVPPFDINRLSGITDSSTRGAIFLTWAALSHYNTSPDVLRARAGAVFHLMLNRQLTARIDQRLRLDEAQTAHHLMEQRGIIGKIILVPH